LFTTLGIALTSGYLTGLIIRMDFFEGPEPHNMFDDEMWWTMDEHEVPLDKKLH